MRRSPLPPTPTPRCKPRLLHPIRRPASPSRCSRPRKRRPTSDPWYDSPRGMVGRGAHGRPSEGAGRPRQRALPTRRLLARGRPSRARGGPRRGVRRRPPHAGSDLSPSGRVRGGPARVAEGPRDQSGLHRGGAQPGHRLQRPRTVRARPADLRGGAGARPRPGHAGAERRRADGQLVAGQDRQPARLRGRRLSLHAPAERRRRGVPPRAVALPHLRGSAPAARAGPARGQRHRRGGGRVPHRRPARAGLRACPAGTGHRPLCGREAGRGPSAMGGSAAHGAAAAHRGHVPEARARAGAEGRFMSDRAYALRFISGKYQGGEYPLSDAGELVIGRSSEQDMVLIEDMVSRKHAKLTLASDQITIADLGSTNGTFVNGEKVQRARLKEGDRILIGTSILKLVAVARRPSPAVVDAKAAQQTLERTAAAQEKRQGGRTAVQGRLEEVPLVDLLQLLSTSKKTGAIVIRGYRGGRVHLRSGKLVSAVIDSDPPPPPQKTTQRRGPGAPGGVGIVPPGGGPP